MEDTSRRPVVCRFVAVCVEGCVARHLVSRALETIRFPLKFNRTNVTNLPQHGSPPGRASSWRETLSRIMKIGGQRVDRTPDRPASEARQDESTPWHGNRKNVKQHELVFFHRTGFGVDRSCVESGGWPNYCTSESENTRTGPDLTPDVTMGVTPTAGDGSKQPDRLEMSR
jgi:hypothetical protein